MKRVKRYLGCLLALLFVCTGCTSNVEQTKAGDVYYEIFVRSFYDTNGDGYGDLKGITAKLDYLDDLGISGLWLMPINPSKTYHKYDVMDYMAIDEQYGSMEDLEELVNEAKKRDIDIILDLVINHTSYYHSWFQTATKHVREGTCEEEDSYCDYYNFSSEKLAKYYQVPGSLVYYEAEFDSNMPDLNLSNPKVQEEIKQIVAFYLNKGIKGFRLDASLHYFENDQKANIEFLTWLNDYVKSIDSEAFVVAENWTGRNTYVEYYQSGISSFDFDLSGATGLITNAIRNGDGYGLASKQVEFEHKIKEIDSTNLNALFISNHDQGRSGSYMNNLQDTKLMASVYLLMPGVPFIYYGEEIGMLGSGSDPNKRMSFLWSDEEYDGMTSKLAEADYTSRRYEALDKQIKDKDSLYNHYKKVLAVRNQYEVFTQGRVEAVDLGNNNLFAMSFKDETTELLVIHNFHSEDTIKVSIDGYKLVSNFDLKSTYKNNELVIEPHTSVVLIKK